MRTRGRGMWHMSAELRYTLGTQIDGASRKRTLWNRLMRRTPLWEEIFTMGNDEFFMFNVYPLFTGDNTEKGAKAELRDYLFKLKP